MCVYTASHSGQLHLYPPNPNVSVLLACFLARCIELSLPLRIMDQIQSSKLFLVYYCHFSLLSSQGALASRLAACSETQSWLVIVVMIGQICNTVCNTCCGLREVLWRATRYGQLSVQTTQLQSANRQPLSPSLPITAIIVILTIHTLLCHPTHSPLNEIRK